MHIQHNKKDLLIISAYFSTATDNSIEEFYEALDSVLETNKDKEPIIGVDINAKIGLNNNQTGKFGISNTNDRGRLLNKWLGEKMSRIDTNLYICINVIRLLHTYYTYIDITTTTITRIHYYYNIST